MSEAPDKEREQLAAEAAQLHDYNEFLSRKEWRDLIADTQEAVDSMQKELLTPMRSMDDAVQKNFTIGKIVGALTMSINAETKRQMLQDSFDKLTAQLKKEGEAK